MPTLPSLLGTPFRGIVLASGLYVAALVAVWF